MLSLILRFIHICYDIAQDFILPIEERIPALFKVIWGIPILKISPFILICRHRDLKVFGKINYLHQTISPQFDFPIEFFAAGYILSFSLLVNRSDSTLLEFAGSMVVDNRGLLLDFASSNKIYQKFFSKKSSPLGLYFKIILISKYSRY